MRCSLISPRANNFFPQAQFVLLEIFFFCFFFFPRGCKRERSRNAAPFFFCRAPNMFHIVSLNGVDSGNAVTLLCLPSFQSEVWPAVLVVLWTGADWAAGAAEVVRLSHVGFLPPPQEPRCPRRWFCVVMFLCLPWSPDSCRLHVNDSDSGSLSYCSASATFSKLHYFAGSWRRINGQKKLLACRELHEKIDTSYVSTVNTKLQAASYFRLAEFSIKTGHG